MVGKTQHKLRGINCQNSCELSSNLPDLRLMLDFEVTTFETFGSTAGGVPRNFLGIVGRMEVRMDENTMHIHTFL